jgi:hypothetical protein
MLPKIPLIGGWNVELYRHGMSGQPVDMAMLQ